MAQSAAVNPPHECTASVATALQWRSALNATVFCLLVRHSPVLHLLLSGSVRLWPLLLTWLNAWPLLWVARWLTWIVCCCITEAAPRVVLRLQVSIQAPTCILPPPWRECSRVGRCSSRRLQRLPRCRLCRMIATPAAPQPRPVWWRDHR